MWSSILPLCTRCCRYTIWTSGRHNVSRGGWSFTAEKGAFQESAAEVQAASGALLWVPCAVWLFLSNALIGFYFLLCMPLRHSFYQRSPSRVGGIQGCSRSAQGVRGQAGTCGRESGKRLGERARRDQPPYGQIIHLWRYRQPCTLPWCVRVHQE